MSDSIEKLRGDVKNVENQIATIQQELDNKRLTLQEKFKALLDTHQVSQVDDSFLKEFFEEPYVMIPKRGHEWYVIVPKWLKMQVGWLEHSTKSFNIFIVNKYAQWVSEIPQVLKDKLKFPKPLPFKVLDGTLFTGTTMQEEGWNKYKQYLSRREGTDRIKITKGLEFQLIAKLIEDGTLPFEQIPVKEEDLRVWNQESTGKQTYDEICKKKDITKIQDRAWEEFKKYGAIGIYWAYGGGKSLFGHRLIACVKGKKLVVVPTKTLVEQWTQRIKLFNPEVINEVTIVTYHAYEKVRKEEWTLIIFDEHQHLPANQFIRLSTVQTKYRIGFSGSPFREDGRENYIIALTGKPIGASWEEMLKLNIIQTPQFRVYVVETKKQKEERLAELLQIPIKTIVFCDSLDYGEELAKVFHVPFIYSETTDRINTILNSETCIVSRVGDEGISDPNLERVIEISFLFGSRMQEGQRFGRLMHSSKKVQHIVIMTREEFELYHKRLDAILERGFKIEYIGA